MFCHLPGFCLHFGYHLCFGAAGCLSSVRPALPVGSTIFGVLHLFRQLRLLPTAHVLLQVGLHWQVVDLESLNPASVPTSTFVDCLDLHVVVMQVYWHDGSLLAALSVHKCPLALFVRRESGS